MATTKKKPPRPKRPLPPHLEALGYTIDETCQVTSFCRAYVYKLLNAGLLESVRVGKRRIIKPASVKRLMEEGTGG